MLARELFFVGATSEDMVTVVIENVCPASWIETYNGHTLTISHQKE